GPRGREDDAKEAQPLDERAHVIEKCWTTAVTGPDHQLVPAARQRIQNPEMDVLDVLRIRIVMNHANEEGAAKGKTARLRIGLVPVLGDDRLHPRARLLVDVGRLVDDARDGFLRHRGETRDVGNSEPGPGRSGARTCRLTACGSPRTTRGTAGCFVAAAHWLFLAV